MEDSSLMELDKRKYERQVMADIGKVSEQIREWPEIQAALSAPIPPPISFQCSRGHKLVTVCIQEDHRGWLSIVPTEDEGSGKSDAVAVASHPFTGGSGICAEPGCPSIVTSTDTCEKHGDLRFNDTGTMRTTYVCKRCPAGKDGPRPITAKQDLQLKHYALALKLGRGSIQLQA